MDTGEILRQARTYVGSHATRPATARDPVNLPMIRRWCEAMGETNPIYTDEAAARAFWARRIKYSSVSREETSIRSASSLLPISLSPVALAVMRFYKRQRRSKAAAPGG